MYIILFVLLLLLLLLRSCNYNYEHYNHNYYEARKPIHFLRINPKDIIWAADGFHPKPKRVKTRKN